MKPVLAAVLSLAAACSSEGSSSSTSLTRVPGECGELETHVIGEYKSSARGDDTTVEVQRPGKHILVLSAVEATRWNVKASNGAQIVKIYAVGMHPQQVDAPAGTKVITESEAEGGGWACGYEWPATSATCDTSQLLHLASIRTNAHATSFHGCYAASRFTIGEDMAVSSDCAVATGQLQSDVITRCDADLDPSNCDDVIY